MSTGTQADLELLLTDGFILLASHMVAGQLDPLTLDPNWHVVRDEVDYMRLLTRIADGENVNQVFKSTWPNNRRYGHLVDALERYRTIAADGGWPAVQEGSTLRLNDVDERVPALRQRLILAADLDPELYMQNEMEENHLDRTLNQFVIRF